MRKRNERKCSQIFLHGASVSFEIFYEKREADTDIVITVLSPILNLVNCSERILAVIENTKRANSSYNFDVQLKLLISAKQLQHERKQF